MQKKRFPSGQYSYLPAGFQYSAGVVAEPGYGIERARFSRPVPLSVGFQRIQAHLAALGRPSEALCACELRSPAVMNESEFIAFNKVYVNYLAQMGLYENEVNPVGRCNLIPAVNPPAEPSLYAFSYTVPVDGPSTVPDFVTSGAAECPDRPGYRDGIVRLGETTPDALGDKLRFALGDLESRFEIMGVSWSDVSDMNLYTVHDMHHLIEQELSKRDAINGGLCWHWVRPPVLDIEIEIDARKLSRTLFLPA